MEPQVRFCTSAEGTPLAYSVMGQGSTLLTTPFTWESMHVAMTDVGKDFFHALSRTHTVVRYDRRGTGLSERKRVDFTVDSEVADIRAVAESLGVDRFALMAGFHLGPAALLYAARYAERVSHLILYGTYASGNELSTDEVKTSLTAMIRSHWAMASRTLADITSPGVSGEVLERIARDERESVDGETVARFVEMGYETAVSRVLAEVPVETLVLHRKKDRAVPFRMSRHLAAAIPNAQLVELEGSIHFPWLGDYQSVLRPIFQFLGDESLASEDAPMPPSGTAIILFADIVDSTRLTEQLGDSAFRERARQLDDAMRAVITKSNGATIEGKLLGDGVLAVFSAARDAITAALACRDASANVGLELHLGIHAGDVIRESDNVYGGAVNIAARISALSAPGEILVSRTVADLARTSAGVAFEERGEHALKGIDDPVHVFTVKALG